MEIIIIDKEYIDSFKFYAYIVGFMFLILQIRLSTKTLKKTLAWNKVQATYSMFNFKRNTDILMNLSQKLDGSISFTEPLTDMESKKILANIQYRELVKEYLNDMEIYCVAINAGIVDNNIAFGMYHPRFIQQYKVFAPFITKLRSTYPIDGDVILIEFELTIIKWQEKVEKRISEKNKKGILEYLKLGTPIKNDIV